jgi:anaerobic magnesium-protoporphyrin IX monomethyl ester cyclase
MSKSPPKTGLVYTPNGGSRMKPVRIFLLDVNHISLDTSIDMIEYPLGLVYVATSLKNAFGDRLLIHIDSYDDKKDTLEDLENKFNDFKPHILGLRSLTMGRKPLHKISTLAKKSCSIPLVIAGGPHATDSPQDILQNESFDCAVIGEGDETAVDLVAKFLANESIDSVPGIAVRSLKSTILTSPRELIQDLDHIPIPDHSLVDYQRINRGHVDFSFRLNVPHANLFSSRGCPYKCIYCHHVFGKQFRAHSPERLMEEIRILHDEHGVTKFQIIDDIFNLDKKRAMRFYELLIRSDLDLVLSFPNGVRGDRVDEEMVDAMWEAGVRYIAYAVETGSPRVQKLIKKHLDLNQIGEAISMSTARGILTRGFFMIGFPTETEEEALMTIEYAKASDLVLAMFFTVVYFPGTPLYRLAQQMSTISDYNLGLEDDYVRTREGPYTFTHDTLEELKLKAVREFFFSEKRLQLSFDIMPNFFNQRDFDASMLVNIISAKISESDIKYPQFAKKMHRYFLMANRFSKKEGFYV